MSTGCASRSGGRMTAFVLSRLLLGGLVGVRLTVFALLPVLALAIGIAATLSILQPALREWTVLELVSLLVFLQIGYLGGAALRMFIWPVRLIGQQERLRSS